jgi:L-threonylcarbamoyladenylate synthase
VALSEELERCIAAGGVVVFPADTVYGLACDPENAEAVQRLYALKGRPADRPAAVMWFDPAGVPDEVPAAARALLPGPVTLLVRSDRYPLAGGAGVLGVRVPDVPLLADVRLPVLQTSANLTGGPDACSVDEVHRRIRAGADLVVDGGDLPGTPSTVIDLTGERFRIVREGAMGADAVAAALGS